MFCWGRNFCAQHTVLGTALIIFIVLVVSSGNMSWASSLSFATVWIAVAYSAWNSPWAQAVLLVLSTPYDSDRDLGRMLDYYLYGLLLLVPYMYDTVFGANPPYWSYLSAPPPGRKPQRKAAASPEPNMSYLNAYSNARADGAPRVDLDLTCWEPSHQADEAAAGAGRTAKSLDLPAGFDAKMFLTLEVSGDPESSAGGNGSKVFAMACGPESADYGSLSTFADVMDLHGIMVLYKTEGRHPEIDAWYWSALGDGPDIQDVMAGGVLAEGAEGIPDRGVPAGLVVCTGGMQVFLLSVAHPLPVLIRVASALHT